MAYHSYLCGCYYYGTEAVPFQGRIKQYLPLLDSEAHSTILSTTSKTTLKQTFTNPSSETAIKECIYTFPLYDGVSVVGFTCKIGSRTLTGLVKEKVKAKKIFDQAVAKGETAGILEQAPEASDVFSTKLGNIPAGKSVTVEIIYSGELKHHEIEGIRFTIPTSIAPRYGQATSHAMATGSQAQQEGGIKITVDINMPDGSFIKGVQSPSHPIAVSMGALSTAGDADPTINKASATLSLGSAALEKDFILIVQCKDVGIPRAILEKHPTIPHHRALMATLVPKFTLPPSRPEIVFVADRSGSMRGNIPMLITAMKVFLKSMPIGVKFNICSFGNKAKFLWPQSKSYTSETLQEATVHVETFNANMGGTETFGAIKSTIDKRFTDLPLEIMLLTDGDIWRQEELFTYINQQVKETEGKIRLFPLGIGNGVSSALIEGLARAGNGFSQSVQQGERLDNSVVRMLRGALTPHITDYTLEVKYEKDDDDFELIDRVTEGLKVLLSDTDTTQPVSQEPKPTISLFDASADPEKEDVKMQDVDYLPKVPHPKLLQAPHKIPSLFAFSRTTVYLLMSPETVQRNPTAVVLRATSVHGPLALEIPIEVLSTPAKTVHQLAARKAVQDLEEGRGWIFDAKDQAGVLVEDRYPSRFEDLVQREAVRLGETFQVAGKWCSFVAVAANDAEIIGDSQGEKHETDEDEYEFPAASSTYSPESPSFSPISPSFSPNSPQNSQRLQGYQMGLMQLEQQNKKRHMMSRQGAPSPAFMVHKGEAHHRMSSQPQAFGPMSESMDPRLANPSAHLQQQQQQRAAPFQHTQYTPQQSQSLFGSSATQVPRSAGALFGAPSVQNSAVASSPVSSPNRVEAQKSNDEEAYLKLFEQSQQPNIGQAASNLFGGIRSEFASVPNSAAPATAASAMGGFGSPGGFQGKRSCSVSSSKQISRNSQKENDKNRYKAMRDLLLTADCRYISRSNADKKSGHPPDIASQQRSSSMSGRLQHLGHRQSRKAKLSSQAMPFTAETASSNVPPAPENWASKSVSEKVHALISLQDFEGSWSPTDPEISRIMGIKIPEAPKGVDEKTWVTLLVTAYLEVNCAAEEGTWGLVVEKATDWQKAKDWLNTTTGLEGAWEQARKIVKG